MCCSPLCGVRTVSPCWTRNEGDPTPHNEMQMKTRKSGTQPGAACRSLGDARVKNRSRAFVARPSPSRTDLGIVEGDFEQSDFLPTGRIRTAFVMWRSVTRPSSKQETYGPDAT